ncbi:Rad17 protein [Martiniozyma asiatica (nom. inval.)]|nr:Rad17 protein [Martiniozyma asiatica]
MVNEITTLPDEITTNNEKFIPLFSATTVHVGILYQLISSIGLFGSQCLLDISKERLCFSIVEGNVCKIKLNLGKQLFESYNYRGVLKLLHQQYNKNTLYGEETQNSQAAELTHDDNAYDPELICTISLDLNSFLETLNILTSDMNNNSSETKCSLLYYNENDPFIFEFEDQFITERCSIETYFIDVDRRTKQTNNSSSNNNNNNNDNNNNNNNNQSNNNDEITIESGFAELDSIVDDSIFKIDGSKVINDIVLKSSVFYEVLKDMVDLHTNKFILYAFKQSDENKRNSQLIFISQSKYDSIGFSKIMIPQRRTNIHEFKLFKPKNFSDLENISPDGNSQEVYVEMENCYELSISSNYHFDYFAKLLKSLKLSRLVKLRKDLNGLTSVLLLLGQGNEQQKALYHGSSIEFVTLESVPLDEYNGIQMDNNINDYLIMNKYGYGSNYVEKIIKDDEDVQTIRVGDDGKLITLDNYFTTMDEFAMAGVTTPAPNQEISAFVPVESLKNTHSEKVSDQLKITDELAQTLLGGGKDIQRDFDDMQRDNGGTDTVINREDVISDSLVERVEVDSTVLQIRETRSRKHYMAMDPQRDGSKKGKKAEDKKTAKKRKENDGIETVGGAVEIPLFI